MELQRQIDRLLAQRASEWHQILEQATEPERAGFVAWLKQSPLHVQEYLEAAYTDRLLGHIDENRLEDVDALVAQIAPSVVPLDVKPSATTTIRRRFGIPKMALAAGAAACAVSIALVYQQLRPEAFATQVGEQRTIQLEDASIITLNADSRVRVRLDEKERDIVLVRGEALFKVAHDQARPFKVQTRTGVIEAVGTQFNVYERTDGTRVSVLEGRVRIHTPQQTRMLDVGAEANVCFDGTIELNTRADVRKSVAWRERRLVFADTPLEEMVHEFNRYSRAMRLRLEGVPPGSHHYNGIFDATDPESLADLLAKEPDLMLERRDAEIVIRRR